MAAGLVGLRRLGVTLGCLVFVTSPARAWVATINGVTDSIHVSSFDQAFDVVFDAAANVVAIGELDRPVTGASVDSVVVTKRDLATGEELWRHVLDDLLPPFPSLVAARVVVDAAGDVIVSAGVDALPSGVAVVVKLAGATGQRVWTAPGYGGGDLALFPDGDVAAGVSSGTVAASSHGRYMPADHLARLAGSDGSEVWRTLALFGAGLDFMVVDPAGDVVTGGYGPGMLAVKASGGNGTLLWSTLISGPANYQGDRATGLAVDASGDVVLAGLLALVYAPPVFDTELTVVKLAASDGSELWRFAEEGGFPAGAEVDPGGDVFTVGFLGNSQVPLALRLDGDDGAEIWRVPVSGLDRVQATFSDGGGRWAMIGQVFATFNETNLAVAELDPSDGQRRQLLAVDGGEEGASASDTPLAATFGPDGRIAVAARIQQRDESNDTDFAVLQFSHRLTGKKLVVRDLPGVQTLSLRSKDRSVLADDPGGAADPSLHGATLTLHNPGSGERVSIALPAAMWTPRPGKRPGAVRYVYQDPTHLAGPCKKAVIKGGGSLAVSCNAGLGGFTLDEATQGALAVELRVTDAARYCFGFVASKDEPGLFVAPEASAPAGCPE